MTKKRIFIDNSKCDFCGTCVLVCPEDAIELRESMITVISECCTLCVHCVNCCPLGIPEVI